MSIPKEITYKPIGDPKSSIPPSERKALKTDPIDEILEAIRPALESAMIKLIQHAAMKNVPDGWGKCSECYFFEMGKLERENRLYGPDFCRGFGNRCNGEEIRCCFRVE